MSAAAAIEQFTAIRARPDAACGLLMEPTPEALDRCSMLLETAGRQMADFQSDLGEVGGIRAHWRRPGVSGAHSCEQPDCLKGRLLFMTDGWRSVEP